MLCLLVLISVNLRPDYCNYSLFVTAVDSLHHRLEKKKKVIKGAKEGMDESCYKVKAERASRFF